MFACNLLGVMLLVLIALFHVIGEAEEKNGEYITFEKKEEWNLANQTVRKECKQAYQIEELNAASGISSVANKRD